MHSIMSAHGRCLLSYFWSMSRLNWQALLGLNPWFYRAQLAFALCFEPLETILGWVQVSSLPSFSLANFAIPLEIALVTLPYGCLSKLKFEYTVNESGTIVA